MYGIRTRDFLSESQASWSCLDEHATNELTRYGAPRKHLRVEDLCLGLSLNQVKHGGSEGS